MDATRPWGGPGHTRPPAPRWLPACPGAPKATQPLALAFPPSRFPVSPPRFFFSRFIFRVYIFNPSGMCLAASERGPVFFSSRWTFARANTSSFTTCPLPTQPNAHLCRILCPRVRGNLFLDSLLFSVVCSSARATLI